MISKVLKHFLGKKYPIHLLCRFSASCFPTHPKLRPKTAGFVEQAPAPSLLRKPTQQGRSDSFPQFQLLQSPSLLRYGFSVPTVREEGLGWVGCEGCQIYREPKTRLSTKFTTILSSQCLSGVWYIPFDPQ